MSAAMDIPREGRFMCSPTRFVSTIQNLSQDHRDAIDKTGLGGLLYMKAVNLRRTMLACIAQSFSINTQTFHIGGKDLPLTLQEVQQIMGLRIEGYDVNLRTQTAMNRENKIMLSDLEHMITTSSVPDEDFIRNFVLFAIGVILAPTTKDYVNSKYLAVVADVADIPKFNWGQFTLTNLLSCINEYKQFNLSFPQGNLALLQIWYWEHVIPKTPPVLMSRWDEGNARLRTEHFQKEGLDGGEVIMNISEVNGLPRP